MQLYHSTPDEELDTSEVRVAVDGVVRTVRAGGLVRLSPAESIFLPCGLYHKFWGEEGKVLIGEVSSINDDTTDNRFHEKVGRLPAIEEDEPPRYLLFSEYPPAQ